MMTAKTAASRSFTRWLWEWTRTIGGALLIWVVVRSLLGQAFHIPSGSMENTLLIGDVLWVNKALYGAEVPIIHRRLPAFREPQRLDIVVFKSVEEEGLDVVKRLIGMPGDTLSMEDGAVLINGRKTDEPYVIRTDPAADPEVPQMRGWQIRYLVSNRDPATYRPTLNNWGPLVVPPDSFFMMGDNRDQSYDSRYWGFLGRDRVEGRPSFIYFSFDKQGILPLPFLTAIRWGRLFSAPR
jgi:signal peptidase I